MTPSAPLAHERAFELLPWLVNGTLGPAERDAVEQHARSCIVCRREIREQQRLHSAVRAQPAIHLSPQAGRDELDRVIGDGAQDGAEARRWGRRYVALQPLAFAAAAGIALLAFLLWLTPLPQSVGEPFATLATPPPGEHVLIDVVFAQQATATEVNALLAEVGGEIVAGPSGVGRYTIRLAAARLDEDEVKRLVARLAADPRVRFAGRSFATRP